jgi:hypothetical protein
MKNLTAVLFAEIFAVYLFLPQQAEAQFPEKLSYQEVIRNSGNQPGIDHPTESYMGINYGEVSAIIAGAIKEQQKIIDDLRNENDLLQERLKKIEALLNLRAME